jgi:hypothetical protein
MRQNSQQTLGFLGLPATRAQRRAETSLMARDRTFDLPALTVDSSKEAPFHLPAVFGAGPGSGPSFACRDNGGTNAKFLSAQYMVVFGIVAGVSQEPIEVNVLRGLPHGRRKLRRILRRAEAHEGAGQQMALAVTHQRQLWPMQSGKAFLAATPDVVAADMARLEPRGIDDALGAFADQRSCVRSPEDDSLEKNEGVFFKSRRSAYERVE